MDVGWLAAQPTLFSFARWVAFQTAFAWWNFAPKDSSLPWVPRRIVAGLLSPATSKNVAAKFRMQEEATAFTGDETHYPDEDYVDSWVETWVAFSFNHGLGGVLMLYGIFYNSPAVWRVGLLFETGEDCMHFLQMGMAVLLKVDPAVKWSRFRYMFLCLHHSLGLLAGVPAYFLLADNYDVQMMCFLLLGAPVPGMAIEAFLTMWDTTQPGLPRSLTNALSILNAFWWAYCRFIVFVPTCMRVVPSVFELHGMRVGVPMFFAIICFLIFNVISTYGLVKVAYHACMPGKQKPLSDVSGEIMRRTSSHRVTIRRALSREIEQSHVKTQ